MAVMLVDHPTAPDFWRHEPPRPRPCAECKVETPWIYLDLCHLHPECDFPAPKPPDWMIQCERCTDDKGFRVWHHPDQHKKLFMEGVHCPDCFDKKRKGCPTCLPPRRGTTGGRDD